MKCYNRLGDEDISFVPCAAAGDSNGPTHCCPRFRQCTTNGLCVRSHKDPDKEQYTVGGCTDPSWESKDCWGVCVAADVPGARPCPDIDGGWSCINNTETECDRESQFFLSTVPVRLYEEPSSSAVSSKSSTSPSPPTTTSQTSVAEESPMESQGDFPSGRPDGHGPTQPLPPASLSETGQPGQTGESADSPTESNTTDSGDGGVDGLHVGLGVGLGVALIALIVLALLFWRNRRKASRGHQEIHSFTDPVTFGGRGKHSCSSSSQPSPVVQHLPTELPGGETPASYGHWQKPELQAEEGTGRHQGSAGGAAVEPKTKSTFWGGKGPLSELPATPRDKVRSLYRGQSST